MPEGAVISSPITESKNDRFRRLAQKRVQKVLDALDQISHLSAAKYEYGEWEAACIVEALREKLEEVERKLNRQKPAKKKFAFE